MSILLHDSMESSQSGKSVRKIRDWAKKKRFKSFIKSLVIYIYILRDISQYEFGQAHVVFVPITYAWGQYLNKP